MWLKDKTASVNVFLEYGYMTNQIGKYYCEQLSGAEISCVVIDGSPWFKAKDVATILGYVNTKRAVQTNVDE